MEIVKGLLALKAQQLICTRKLHSNNLTALLVCSVNDG